MAENTDPHRIRSEAPHRLNHPVFAPPGAVITPDVEAQIQEDLRRHGLEETRLTYGRHEYLEFFAAIGNIYCDLEATQHLKAKGKGRAATSPCPASAIIEVTFPPSSPSSVTARASRSCLA